ncbi:hypothetical protein BC833DRAFT_599360 [Globomyces pollinis-pini]|nr:hypothetical protein BC833DRAFT_599360 [Globomyces pollinis-pini]KAJ2994779.1 bud emergence protein 1 [Globomyces sp. JEL0801]
MQSIYSTVGASEFQRRIPRKQPNGFGRANTFNDEEVPPVPVLQRQYSQSPQPQRPYSQSPQPQRTYSQSPPQRQQSQSPISRKSSSRRRTNLSIVPRGSSHPQTIFNLPPRKIIRATVGYIAQTEAEVSFAAGDYFYVVNDNRPDDYYEVVNPLEKTRGLATRYYFEDIKGDQPYASPPMSPPAEALEYHNPNPRTTSIIRVNPKALNDITKNANSVDFNLKELVDTIDVPRIEISNNQWIYTIQIIRRDGITRILKRSYDDFWALQVSLLNFFPTESGYSTSGRIIPHMPKPTGLTKQGAEERQNYLAFYLITLVSLPSRILNSPYVTKFFTLRHGDLDTSVPLVFDYSNTMMDLIDLMREDRTVTITLVLGNDTLSWKERHDITYDQLLESIQPRLGFDFGRVLYKDEAEILITLYDDDDLHLLFQLDSVTLYVS